MAIDKDQDHADFCCGSRYNFFVFFLINVV